MIIDRSNYEIWLTDMLDGKLKDDQIAELMSFLDLNPDLKEELEAVSSIHLNHAEVSYPGKDLLKKSVSEMTDSQFEYLCIAHLEHDLNDDQEKELEEIIRQNSRRRKIFQLFNKVVLHPVGSGYTTRNSLKRSLLLPYIKPVYLKLISAAAMIAFVFAAFLVLPERKPEQNLFNAERYLPDTLSIKVIPPVQKKLLAASVEKIPVHVPVKNDLITILPGSWVSDADSTPSGIEKIQFSDVLSEISFEISTEGNQLISFNHEVVKSDFYDERTRLGKFLSRTYRDLVLKEEVASEKPVKGYEIAEGGINGLNKLFGWEMALTKSNDENGELKSLYFSSRILKFNAPVKKED
jgi:hypothetical protein